MLVTTTESVEGKKIVEYMGICSGEAIVGANVFKDLFASITDVVGGRSGTYEKILHDAKNTAITEMAEQADKWGAHGIVGVDIDYEVLGKDNGMLMVVANGTAVKFG